MTTIAGMDMVMGMDMGAVTTTGTIVVGAMTVTAKAMVTAMGTTSTRTKA
jgi:hypothetical protein